MSRPVKPGIEDDPRYNIRVLERALRILSLLGDGKPRTLADISKEIDLNYSTTFRLLSTLAFYRYVKRNKNSNQYQLGLSCLELAQAFLAGNDLRMIAIPELESLRDETKETVHLAVLVDMEIVYLEKLPGLHAIGLMSSRVGGRAPAYCTGIGKALLAYQKPEIVQSYYKEHGLKRFTETTITDLNSLMSTLEEVRCNNYAFDHGEHEDEVRCIAIPIFDISSQVVAALSISGPSARMDPLEDNTEMIEMAKETGMRISQQLGYVPGKFINEV